MPKTNEKKKLMSLVIRAAERAWRKTANGGAIDTTLREEIEIAIETFG